MIFLYRKTYYGQGLAVKNRRVKLAGNRNSFQANPQDSGFSVLTDRDGRVGAAARNCENRRVAVYREV